MKASRFAQFGAALGGAVLLALGAAAPAHAAVNITSGHIDAVNVACDWNGSQAVYSLGFKIGSTVYSAADIDDYVFEYNESALTWDAGAGSWAVTSGTSGVPDVGFSYARNHASCVAGVQIYAASVDQMVFEADTAANGVMDSDNGTALLLGNGTATHVHGDWTFFGGNSSGGSWDASFYVYAHDGSALPGLASNQVTLYQVVVQ